MSVPINLEMARKVQEMLNKGKRPTAIIYDLKTHDYIPVVEHQNMKKGKMAWNTQIGWLLLYFNSTP